MNGPLVGQRVVRGGIYVAPGTIDLAERIHDTHESIGIIPVWPRVPERLEHAGESPCGVHGEEDIVKNDESLEEFCLTESPGFVSAALVHAIEQTNGDGVDTGNGDRDAHI